VGFAAVIVRVSDCRMGKMTPPARAVLLGIIGARTRSAATRL